MKFSTVFGVISLAFASFSAAAEEPVSEEPASLDFKVLYNIKGQEGSNAFRLFNEDEVEIAYQFNNNQPEEVTIIGFAGSLNDAETMKSSYNLSASSVAPVTVEPSKIGTVSQKLTLDVIPDTYILSPIIYVNYMNTIYGVSAQNAFVTVEDHAISLFNPELLLALVLLSAVVGGIGYVIATAFVIPYLNKNYFKKNAIKTASKSTVSSTSSKKKSASNASTTGSKKVYDASWLPETHLKTRSKKK